MTNHQFLNDDRSLQCVQFANGVTADFALERGLLRVWRSQKTLNDDGFCGE